MPKLTRRQLFERVLKESEEWLDQVGMMDIKTIEALKKEKSITTDSVVKAVETFVLPALKEGILENYVRAELQKAAIMTTELMGSLVLNQHLTKKLATFDKRIRSITAGEIEVIVRQLSRLGKILLLKSTT